MVNNRRSARAVRPWHPWRGHSLLQGCRGRREGVFRVLAGVSGIGGECFPGWAGGSSAVTGLLLIWVPGVPAVTRRACASGPGQHYGPAGTGGSAEARTAIGSCPARCAVGVALVLLVLLVLLVAGEPG